MPNTSRYTATLTTGSLKPRESRIVAELLLDGVSDAAWKDAIKRKNVLQARAPGSAVVLARLLRARLECFDAPLWLMVRDGNKELSAQALLACAVKHSTLLRDFMDLTLGDEYRMFRPTLAAGVWSTFLEGCRSRDPAMPDWSESTQDRLRSTVFQILSQAGYLSDTAARELKTVTILPELISYLRENGETHLIRCLQLP
ncbi:MAG: DUF1819 family protein [Verrucomicrobia bacterium]|nr:DUF1819 family protein [Verrucomicrobiota bacterium]